MQRKPRVNSESQNELDKAQAKFDAFQEQINSVSNDVNAKPKAEEVEPQTKMSSKEIKEAPEIYLKPTRTIDPPPNPKTGKYVDKFNEKFREQWEYDKQLVRFIAENHEIIGESITLWTRPYGGRPAEEWTVPVNKPVWGPRYLAEQIKRKCYRRLRMEEGMSSANQVGSDGMGSYFGKMVAESSIQRLDARPAPKTTQVSFHRVGNF